MCLESIISLVGLGESSTIIIILERTGQRLKLASWSTCDAGVRPGVWIQGTHRGKHGSRLVSIFRRQTWVFQSKLASQSPGKLWVSIHKVQSKSTPTSRSPHHCYPHKLTCPYTHHTEIIPEGQGAIFPSLKMSPPPLTTYGCIVTIDSKTAHPV